jgi:predicted MFS family arabinose efflux permease
MVSGVSGFMVLSTLGILLPAISADLHISPLQQGLLGSSAFWGNIALAIPLSWWTSRYGPKALTSVTLILGTAVLFLQAWAPAFTVLMAGRLAFGITVMARQPARVSLTQQWFAAREIVFVNSVQNLCFGLVVGAGLATSPYILAAFGYDWRATLNVFAGFFVVLTLSWMIWGRERKNPEQTGPQEPQETRETGVVRGALGFRDLWVQGFGFVGATLCWSAFLAFYPTLMLNTYQLSLHWSGAILALGVFAGGTAGLGLGYIVMKKGHGKLILQILGILMPVTYLGMIMTGSIPILIILALLNGVAWGFWPILFTVPFHLPGIQPRQVAVAVSVTMMMSSIGTALGPLSAGLFQQALGDLQQALFIISFSGFSLTAAGIFLRTGTQAQVEDQDGAAPPVRRDRS